MFIDSHAHLNFAAFKDDFDEVLKRSLENDIWVINVGTKYETSKKAVEIAQKYEKGVYASVGLHPVHLEERKIDPVEVDFQNQFETSAEKFDYKKYRDLVLRQGSGQAQNKKVVAIGETGFDYYWKPKTKKKFEIFKEKQREVLLNQLKLAEELSLPVIFHCRLAHQDLIEVLKSKIKNQKSKIRGVMHCFVGSLEQLQRYLEMGFYIGFDGIIFKKIEGIDFQEIIKNTPLDRILIETDCPYLIPTLSQERNTPLYLKYIAEKIAKIKALSFEKIAEITTKNAKKLFNI